MYASFLRHLPRFAHRNLSLARRSSTTMSATKIVHWDSKTCPYAQRSWIALLEKQVPFEIEVVDLSNKSKEFCELYSTINPDPKAAAKVPILIDNDVKLIESGIICEYLATRYADQGAQLLPADPVAAAKVRLYCDTFSGQITGAMMGMLRADNQEALEAAKDKLVQGLKVVDQFLRWHGSEDGGAYFLGGRYSLAEVFCTSFVQRIVTMLPHYRGVDVWALVKDSQLDRLERWMHAALSRPSAVESRPADDVVIQSMAKFVSPMSKA